MLLGALSHAVIVWSTHFCEAILRSPHHAQARRHQSRRIALLLAGSAAVLMGVPTGWWPLTVTGAGLVIVAVGWHGWALATMMRRALPGRFRITVRYYIAAATSLVIGAGLGATLASVPDDPWHGRLLLAHTMANLLGWVGLTVHRHPAHLLAHPAAHPNRRARRTLGTPGAAGADRRSAGGDHRRTGR